MNNETQKAPADGSGINIQINGNLWSGKNLILVTLKCKTEMDFLKAVFS